MCVMKARNGFRALLWRKRIAEPSESTAPLTGWGAENNAFGCEKVMITPNG
jgi:hypothetical protein